jgi:mRNA interferase MazF
MKLNKKTPKRGDIIYMDLDPTKGHEQSGKRPFFVLSSEAYNKATGLVAGCPLTNKVKGYPFEVVLPKRCKAKGVILANQITTKDWRVREANQFAKTDDETLENVLEVIDLIFRG